MELGSAYEQNRLTSQHGAMQVASDLMSNSLPLKNSSLVETENLFRWFWRSEAQ